MRFVLSTVGTSILTNLIDRENRIESTWWQQLRDSANLTLEDIRGEEIEEIINTLAERALDRLLENDVETNRRMSAELNGIYGIYGGQLPRDSNDEHTLICSDTAQGQQTGELIQDFLGSQGFQVSIFTPPRLSTQDSESFTAGIKELIRWLEDNVPWRSESGYQVIFNLVGGFKSLQGYMNTFGAFYADEVVYIFEALTADLIRIPRLPIQIDTTVIEEHRLEFALMAAGKYYRREALEGIPETLLEMVDENGNTEAVLSEWGELLWLRTKSDLLSEELLTFPQLEYAQSFRNDCENLNSQQQTDLQETLAKIAVVLEDTDGDFTKLNDRVSGLNFEHLTNLDGIYTFRISKNFRVSCQRADRVLTLRHYGGVTLRHYGTHQYVYANP